MPRVRLIIALFLIVGLSACAESKWAPDEAVAKAVYHDDEPTSVTLMTMINNRTGGGGHSALLINASQRIVFDPAGTWWNRNVPERNDVLYGMSPAAFQTYVDFHARDTYHVVFQEKKVTPEIAEILKQRVEANGAVRKAMCSNSVTKILRDVPGFESMPVTLYPEKTMENFAALEGVTTDRVFQNDNGKN